MIIAETLANRIVDQGGDFSRYSYTRINATSFSFLGADFSQEILKGTKIELNNAGTVKYGYVISCTYSTGTNTVTVTALNTSSRTITDIAVGTITNVYFGNGTSLRSHPISIKYTPTVTGFSSVPTGEYSFWVQGSVCTLNIQQHADGTSNTTNFEISSPFSSANITANDIYTNDAFNEVDNGTTTTNRAGFAISNNASVVVCQRSASAGANYSATGWTASGGKRIRGTIDFVIR
jgi:hypothetical protein